MVKTSTDVQWAIGASKSLTLI